MQICFITTCSRNKIAGGLDYKSWGKTCSVGPRLLEARKGLYVKLRMGQSGLGNGKDFAGTDSGSYLPAWLRYARGAFMGSVQEGLREQWFADAKQVLHEENAISRWLKKYPLFFISGLYGLVPARELIQDYDVRLKGEVEVFWKNSAKLIARELDAQLDGKKQENILVLDCCGSFQYSKLIDWEYLPNCGIQVWHAVSDVLENAQVRAEAGRMATQFKMDSDLEVLKTIETGINFLDTAEFLKHSEEQKTLKHLPLVGVACLTGEQRKKFEAYARKQHWTEHFIFEYAVNRTIPYDWIKRGVRQLICHVDNDHSSVRSTFGDLSKFPDLIKIKYNEYAPLELRFRYRS